NHQKRSGKFFSGLSLGDFGRTTTLSYFRTLPGMRLKLLRYRGNWVCLNTDGSVWNEGRFAAAGGIVKTRDGRGILNGLTLLIDRGYNRGLIQTDNLERVQVIQEKIANESNFALVQRIHHLLRHFSHWQFGHISREDN
ncbi:hypothetical protein Gotur_013946, partial [Gossypium turneri]